MQHLTSFEEAGTLSFQQSWLSEPEPGFQRGEVRVGWQPEGFRMQATLMDRDVFNPETGFNERFFLQGDVIEWFLQPLGADEYWEFHVGPEGQLYQVRFPSKPAFDALRSTGIPREWMISNPIIEVSTRFLCGCWQIDAFLPVSMLNRSQLLANEVWKMSFCRYDYNRNPENVILSSTSPLSALDFHIISEWDDFMLC